MGNGPIVLHCAVERQDLKLDMCWTGQIMSGQRWVLEHYIINCISTISKYKVGLKY